MARATEKKSPKISQLNLEDEEPFISSYVYMLNSLKEMIPNIDVNHLQLQILEIYHTLRNEEKYSNFAENSSEILEEWKNRVYYAIFPDNP